LLDTVLQAVISIQLFLNRLVKLWSTQEMLYEYKTTLAIATETGI